MKPLLPLLAVVVAIFLSITTFSQAKECTVEYHKGNKIAAMLEMPYSTEVVQDAVKDYLSKKSTRSDRSRGFEIYRNAKLRHDDPEMTDVHCKVERKGRNSNGESVIYVLIGRPGENVSVRTADDHYKLDEAKSLLNEMISSINAYNIDLKIKNQEALVKKAEKKLQNLEADQKELEKQIKLLQARLEENKNDQRKQVDEIAKQRMTLASVQGRRN